MTTTRWKVIRQDDNGQVYLVANDLTEADATRLVAEFEARAHKQTYYAIVDQPD